MLPVGGWANLPAHPPARRRPPARYPKSHSHQAVPGELALLLSACALRRRPTRAARSTRWRSGTLWWTPRSRGWRPGACSVPRAPSRSRRRLRHPRPSPARGPRTAQPSRSGSTTAPSTNGSLKVGSKQSFLSPLCGNMANDLAMQPANFPLLMEYAHVRCLGGETVEQEEKLDANRILFSGNDYMGLSSHPAVREAAVKVCQFFAAAR